MTDIPGGSARRVPTAVLAVAACLLWSTAFAGVKTGLNWAPPFRFAGLRFILAGLLLVPLAGGPRRYIREILKAPGLVAVVALFQTFGLYSLFFLSVNAVPASVAAVVNGMFPLWNALVAHFLLPGDRLDRRMILSLLIGAAGIAVLGFSRGGLGGAVGFREAGGILLMLAAGFSSSLGAVFVARRRGTLDIRVLTSAQFILGGAGLLVLSRLTEGPLTLSFPPAFWAALVYLAFLSAAAFSLWFHLLAVRGERLSVIGLWQFLTPVMGAVFSWLIVPGDRPDPVLLLAMVLIAGAILLYFRSSGNRA